MKNHRGACLPGGHELRYRPNPKWPPSAIMKFQLFFFLSRCKCNTSNLTEIGVGNSFLILFLPSGVIVTSEGQGQDHFVLSTISVNIWHSEGFIHI